MHSARSAAAQILKQVWVKKRSLTQAIPEFCKYLPPEEISLTKALCFGVIRHQETLSDAIEPLLNNPFRSKDKDILALLLIGAYQLSAMRTPEYAAIDSCVTACRELKKEWACSLTNAILRKYQSQLDIWPSKYSEQVASEHPEWLYNKIRFRWPEYADEILTANNQEPPLCLRVNQQQISRDDYATKLEAADLAYRLGDYGDEAIYLLDRKQDVQTLPGFAEGEISVQDEAPQLSAQLLDLQPGQRVLDACAAPGGKTCHILETEPALEKLIAVDIDASRLKRVKENLQRLQLTADCVAADISKLDKWWDGQAFDRILCDAPCSATGVIRRHPDIKYLRRESDIQKLSNLQLKILQNLWQCLKPGGILLYATCSIMPEENNALIKRFLAQQSDCQAIKLDTDFGIPTEHGRQLLPQTHGHDGFYYAKLQKLASQG